MNRGVRIGIVLAGVALFAGGFLLYPQTPPLRVFSEDEQKVLAIPKSDPDGKRLNFDLITRTARPVDAVHIRGCVLDPVVPRLEVGREFDLRNDDLVERTIEVDRDHVFRIPAGGKVRTVADFGFGEGMYGCACDNASSSCGIFWMTKKED